MTTQKVIYILIAGTLLLATGVFLLWHFFATQRGTLPRAEREVEPASLRSGKHRGKNSEQMHREFQQFDVRTMVVGEEMFAPGYFDRSSNTFYQWKGVILKKDQLPFATPFTRIPLIKPDNLKIQPVDALVSYQRLDKDRFIPGYFDWSSRTFYQWKGIVIDREEIPDAYRSPDGKIGSVHDDEIVKVVEFEVPKHLLEEPHRWKKGDEDESSQ